MAIRSTQQIRMITYNVDPDIRLTSAKGEVLYTGNDPEVALSSVKTEVLYSFATPPGSGVSAAPVVIIFSG